MQQQLKHTSKFLSLVLRHKPEEIGLVLNEQGWANVAELITKVNANGILLNESILNTIVATNDKKRFAFNEDKTMIRASQGHSIEVDLQLQPVQPPEILYHGTTEKFVSSILKNGLQKQNRQHVHLSATIDTATAVGSRHGKPVILVVQAQQMHQSGFAFYVSANNVWLANEVPAAYLQKL